MGTPARDVPADGMVGRRRELSLLRGWLDGARGGVGRLVLCAGEPGIGKTRLAQELAGSALAGGSAVAWARCVETAGAPAFWPWRQVLRTLGTDPHGLLAGDAESPEERFRVFDEVSESLRSAAGEGGLVVILDDIHWGDEPSLLVLRHVADHVADARLLLFAAYRDVEPASVLPRVLPDLLRARGAERLDLRGFDLGEVREQLSMTTVAEDDADARAVLDVTGGNPLFVREVARAMAEGTWCRDRPPRTVLDVVAARLARVSVECSTLLQTAAIVGRDFSLGLVAAALDVPVDRCPPAIDEATDHGLIDEVGATGDYRFVHSLTRDAVEASLSTADRVALHRDVATATAARFAGDLSEHLADIARHWAELAPHGEATRAREWTVRAGDEAVRRLAYEEGVRLYRAALAFETAGLPDAERCRILNALGRAAHLAGDLPAAVSAATAAAAAARSVGSAELAGEAALILEAAPDAVVNTVAKQLCEQALGGLGDSGARDTRNGALRARLLAQRSHLAFYDGEQHRVESLSSAALELARESRDDAALGEALRARQEACPGPAGRVERLALGTEMIALAQRTGSARTAMWGELWRIDASVESGRIAAAAEELPALQLAVERVGGPVSGWHLDRTRACIAQAQGRFVDAATAAQRGFERMRDVERAPATGAYFALQCALATQVGVSDGAEEFIRHAFDPPPRFRTMFRITRAILFLSAGSPDEAAASYQQAGPLDTWALPAFFVLPGYAYAARICAELGRHDELAGLLDRLAPLRGEHAVGSGVFYLGPVELALGRGAAALGRVDDAIEHLAVAAEQADRAGAPGFVAEARYHLATALRARGRTGDHERAGSAARDADRLARALGMTAYVERTAALATQLDATPRGPLSAREMEVAELVAEGLTSRQIAERLFISERTAQTHVQHILTKLGFTSRSQIAAWSVRSTNQ